MGILDIAASYLDDQFEILRVFSVTGAGAYILQMTGRDQDLHAHNMADEDHSVGDEVIVLIQPSRQMAVIIGKSPWQVNTR